MLFHPLMMTKGSGMQCGLLTGVCLRSAALCQVFDSIYGDVPMHKVKFNARTEYDYLNNFKVLTSE